jgi:hypothetical protein
MDAIAMSTSLLKRSLPVVLTAFALGACQTPVTQEQSGTVIGGGAPNPDCSMAVKGNPT